MKGPTSTNLKASFLANTTGLRQAHIDWLTKRSGVPPLALAYDGDGYGWPIGAAKVERVGRRFQFRPEDGAGAFVVLAPGDARRILEGLTLQAADLSHGEELRRLLTPPRPRIVVPSGTVQQVAA